MSSRQPLEGVKVLDFGWVVAGPRGTQCLADHGAIVIKVESAKRFDVNRLSEPYKDDIVDPDGSGLFVAHNSSKHSISLNLNHPRGLEVAKRLVGWADVVTENFRPGVIERIGLGYEELKKIKPDIIMASSSILGQQGVYSNFSGWGTTGAAISGHFHLTGWPDREPTKPGSIAVADVVQPLFAVALIIAALDYRCRTGQGQYLDLPQFEPMAHLIAPALLDYRVNRRRQTRVGNRSPNAAPHGAFRCGKDDRWCAIAVSTEEEWQAFRKAIGSLEWTADPKFATLESRKQNEDELERLVEEWTINHSPQEVMDRMQAAGVPAGVVQTAEDLLEYDPQLKARRSFIPLEHPIMGMCNHPTPPFKLLKSPAQVQPAPTFGQHNYYVYSEVLEMSDEEIAELTTAGAFE